MSNTEVLTATRPDRTDRSLQITVLERREMEGGGDKKWRIVGDVGGHHLSFIERLSPPNFPYEKKWQRLKDAGFTVVPSLLISSQTNNERTRRTVLVTDMRADGSELYGQNFNCEESRSEINRFFLDLTTPKKITQIEQKGLEYVDLANRLGILLPTDPSGAFTFHVRPDGSWDWDILDPILAEFEPKDIMRGLEGLPAEAGMDYDSFLKYILAINNAAGLEASLKMVRAIRDDLLLAA